MTEHEYTEVELRDAWNALARLLGKLRTVSHRADWLIECLDTLVELLGADRGLILVHEAGGDHVIQARGPGGQLDLRERHEVSQTLMRQALESGRCEVWEIGEDATESLAHLGVVTAAVMPLLPVGGEGPPTGAIYIDYRIPRRVFDDTARELLQAGADMLSVLLDRAEALSEVSSALLDVRRDAETPSLSDVLVGESMAELRKEIATLGEETPLLVTGESGTGKTLLCRAIAAASKRRPIVRALLGSSDDLNTITSELFGHERGAFSGAVGRRIGLVERADGGTLILDEVLSLPHHAQQLLLDVTQFGTFRPLGWTGSESKRASVRLMAATNGNLEEAIRDGKLRQDLYYRLAGATLHLPPLRERVADIVPLAQGILARVDGSRDWRLTIGLRTRLSDPSLDWPGNLRQLEMLLRRARDRALAEDESCDELDTRHVLDRELSGPSTRDDRMPSTLEAVQARRDRLDEQEREILAGVLVEHGGIVAKAARALDMPRTSLISRMERLGLRGRGP